LNQAILTLPVRSVTLPGLGHFVHREDPDKVALLIEQWIGTAPAPPQ
jgi:pimeloyl-ACP methyl ester carboxylesterase